MDSPLASKFVQAANYTPLAANDERVIDWVVIHDMEMDETAHTAEDCANFFHNQKPDPKTGSSAHKCIDDDSVVETVREHDVAWHAPHANHNGIGIEHAGRASQRADQWADAFSDAMLRLSARVTADICRRRNLPIRFVDAAGLKRGDKGITTHWEVTKAFGPAGGHTDPGPNFPMTHYIGLVLAANGAPQPEEDTMTEEQFKRMMDVGFGFLHAKADVTNKLLGDLLKAQGQEVDIDKMELDALQKIQSKP